MGQRRSENRGVLVAILVVGVLILVALVGLVALSSAQLVQMAALNSVLSSVGIGPIIVVAVAVIGVLAAIWAWFEGLF